MGCGQKCQARSLIVMFAIGGASVGALVSPLLGEKRGVGALVGAALSGLGMTLLQMDNLKGKKRNVKRYTSATGNKETSLGGGDDRAIGGRKKNYTCKCPYGSNFSGSTSYTITAHSSLRARRICSRYGKGCYLESSYGV